MSMEEHLNSSEAHYVFSSTEGPSRLEVYRLDGGGILLRARDGASQVFIGPVPAAFVAHLVEAISPPPNP